MKKKAKPKPKVKPKVKPKKKPKKVKKLRITDRGVPVTGLFDEDSDWRLKQVHLNVNQVKKAVYDLSINVEGEHDHIHKTIQRCHDRIEHVEGLVTELTGKIDGMLEELNKYLDALNALPYMAEKYRDNVPIEQRRNEMHPFSKQAYRTDFGQMKKDAEWKIREALKDVDIAQKDMEDGIDPNKRHDDDDDDTYDKRQRGIDPNGDEDLR